MTSITNIEEYLNIETGDKKLCDGKYKLKKNKYYYFKDEYYIINVAGNKWFIASDCRRTRRLLRSNTWNCNDRRGYIRNSICKLSFHREMLQCDDDLVGDHINRKPFDNRIENLRAITVQDNMKNKTKSIRNTSGKQGVSKARKRGYHYWIAQIYNLEGQTIQKYFNIKKLGNDKAYTLAVAKRRELEQEFGYLGE